VTIEAEAFFMSDPELAGTARGLVADTEPWCDVSNLSDFEVVQYVRHQAVAQRLWRETGFGSVDRPGDREQLEESELEDLAEKHDVGFLVLDANGEPYTGLAYRITGPDGEPEDGELPANGQVDRKNVESEMYTLTLREIRDAAWGGETACAEVGVELTAAVQGYDDGTEVQIRLFRQYAETDDDLLEELSATVSHGRVRTVWTYVHDREGPFAKEHDIVEVVAEVRIGTDGPWDKTVVPLALQLPTVDDADWSDHEVAPGEEITLSLTAVGVPDGTPLAIQIFKCRRSGEQLLIDEFDDLCVEGEQVAVAWAYPESDDADAPLVEAECFFIATLDGDPNRITVSDMLTVSNATDDDDDQGDD
jgi:hypothetical protein